MPVEKIVPSPQKNLTKKKLYLNLLSIKNKEMQPNKLLLIRMVKKRQYKKNKKRRKKLRIRMIKIVPWDLQPMKVSTQHVKISLISYKNNNYTIIELLKK